MTCFGLTQTWAQTQQLAGQNRLARSSLSPVQSNRWWKCVLFPPDVSLSIPHSCLSHKALWSLSSLVTYCYGNIVWYCLLQPHVSTITTVSKRPVTTSLLTLQTNKWRQAITVEQTNKVLVHYRIKVVLHVYGAKFEITDLISSKVLIWYSM